MDNTQAHILADICDNTRDLVAFYLKDIPENQWHTSHVMDSKQLNSIAWELLHMAWAENALILKACGGKEVVNEHFDKVKIGAPQIDSSELPSVEEIKSVFEEVHLKSISFIRSLSNEQLDEKNLLEMNFKRGNSKRLSIYHHIRHEGTHIGQLSVLAKIKGIKKI